MTLTVFSETLLALCDTQRFLSIAYRLTIYESFSFCVKDFSDVENKCSISWNLFFFYGRLSVLTPNADKMCLFIFDPPSCIRFQEEGKRTRKDDLLSGGQVRRPRQVILNICTLNFRSKTSLILFKKVCCDTNTLNFESNPTYVF